jgi:AsmA protein
MDEMDFQGMGWLAMSSVLESAKKAWATKRYVRIGAIAVGVVVLLLLLLPLFINVNNFRPKVESEASDAFGRKVTLGNLSLSVFSGNVSADDVAIADDPAFSNAAFLTAKSLKIGVEMMPLIFSRQLVVTGVTIEKPQITLLKAANGRWNFSSIGGASAKKQGGTTPTNFSIAKFNVHDGTLSVGKANSAAKAAIYDDVNIAMTDFSFTSQFPFQLTGRLPGGGDVSISGKAGPINAEDASRTPMETAVKVNDMNVGSLGLIDPASGIAGVVNFDGTLTSNGSQATAVGVMTGKQMKFARDGSPAPMTITVKHAVDFDLASQTGTIRQGDIAIGGAQAHLTGTFKDQGETEVVNLKLNAPNMPVNEVQAALPAAGVVLPSGSRLNGGTLSAELAITGALDKLVITGPVRISNSQLANFNLGAKLGALSAFTGKAASSPNTSIQNASLDARVAPEGMRANNINLNVPAIGVITGAGTVSPAGALAFKMVANLQGGIAGGVMKVAGAGMGRSGIPFAVEGTTSDPKFVPDVGGAALGLAQGEIGNLTKGQIPGGSSVAKGVGSLFGGKKK